jgi:tRNA nucleotidyltransferase (CCA-adding enzyme)
MSDYMFMLENHLSSAQSKMIADIQAVAAEANVAIFLTGGAMRDMLGGFPLREIDFTVEGNALKLAKAIAAKAGAKVESIDEQRKLARLQFPGGALTTIGMARTERYSKPGAKPQVHPATIYEDLRGRDFTINAIAISLSRASRALIVDPNNGIGDLERHELRAISNYTLYDDPVRMLRLLRFRARLGFTIDERTMSQFENAREAEMHTRITPEALMDELRHTAEEPDPGAVIAALDEQKLLHLYSPALTGAKLNTAGFQKLHKANQMVPFGSDTRVENFGLFLNVLTEKLTPKEKAALIKALGMPKADVERWQKLEGRAKKLESALKAATLRKASQVYAVLRKAAGEEILFLIVRSSLRVVQDRIRNYFEKYLPAAQEVTEAEVQAAGGGVPGTPKYEKMRAQTIAKKLDARPRKPPEPTPEELAAANGAPGAPGTPGTPGAPGAPGGEVKRRSPDPVLALSARRRAQEPVVTGARK